MNTRLFNRLRSNFRLLPVLIITIVLCCLKVNGQTDSLILSNGDVIVGEIKSMNKGILQIETDYSSSDFKVEWDRIREIYSNRTYLITLSNGTRTNESFSTDPENPEQIIIGDPEAGVKVDIMDLVYINPLDQTFLSRLNAAVSVGYNYTKNNNLSQFSSRISLGYVADFWTLSGSLDMVTSSQDDIEDISRTDGLISFSYFLKNDWYLIGNADFLSNDEQKLKLRSAFSAGLGKMLVHTNQVQLGVSGGGVWNEETYTDETIESRSSQEAFIGSRLDIFDIGDLDLLTSVTVYPSLSESGRIRTDFKFDLKYDLPLDFYIQFGYTLNYDNDPVEGASSSDFVLQTTLGWDL